MKSKLFVLAFVLVLSSLAATPIVAAPFHSTSLREIMAAPCVPGATYEPACDVNHDGAVNVLDVQLTAGHWNQTGTWLSDNDHDHLGQTWTGTDNPVTIQGTYGSPYWAPLILSNSGGVGLRVNAAGGSGVWVESTGNSGLLVDTAADDGVHVCSTGSANGCTSNTTNDGVDIGNAQHYGIRVGSAGYDGMHVDSADNSGVYVSSASSNGVYVGSANYGVNVAGLNLAGFFLGNINVTGNCTGCLLATFAGNVGDTLLAPGDLVSLAGLRASGVDSVPMLMEVRTAAGGDTVVGVVQGWAELVTEEEPRPTEIGLRLVPREGPADPGQYVTIAYSGLAQVKASGPIEKGARLTVGDDGRARSLQTRTLDGMEVTEGAQPIGVALEALDEGEGLIWALVNVQ